jgi:hypothetical protein
MMTVDGFISLSPKIQTFGDNGNETIVEKKKLIYLN